MKIQKEIKNAKAPTGSGIGADSCSQLEHIWRYSARKYLR